MRRKKKEKKEKFCILFRWNLFNFAFLRILLDLILARLNSRSEYYRHFYYRFACREASNHIFHMFRFCIRSNGFKSFAFIHGRLDLNEK